MRKETRKPTGFTLIELLVVITIIAMLMAMLAPATQQVREAARRINCQSNLKNMGIAFETYKSTHQSFPPGIPNCAPPDKHWVTGGTQAGAICSGPPWLAAILGGLGENQLQLGMESCIDNGDCRSFADDAEHYQVGNTTPKIMICPSAPRMSVSKMLNSNWNLETLSKGNYAACFGAGTYEDAITNPKDRPQTEAKKDALRGAFRVVSLNWRTNPGSRRIRMVQDEKSEGSTAFLNKKRLGYGKGTKSFRDGASKTIAVSEVVGYDNAQDGRGVWMTTAMGSSTFSARTPPNANGESNKNFFDKIPFCYSRIPTDDSFRRRCEQNRKDGNTWAAARSAHPNGVNILMCDGSVRFLPNSVEERAYAAMATVAGYDNID